MDIFAPGGHSVNRGAGGNDTFSQWLNRSSAWFRVKIQSVSYLILCSNCHREFHGGLWTVDDLPVKAPRPATAGRKRARKSRKASVRVSTEERREIVRERQAKLFNVLSGVI